MAVDTKTDAHFHQTFLNSSTSWLHSISISYINICDWIWENVYSSHIRFFDFGDS